MHPQRHFRAALWLTFACVSLAPFAAPSGLAKPPPTAPGRYKDWDGGELEDVEIVQSFHLSLYRKIVVLPIDASGLKMPTDNTRVPMQKVLADAARHFAEALDGEMPNRMGIKVGPGPRDALREPRVIFLKARFVEMDPGSASARAFSQGFAGATQITLAGEFIDAMTGKPLVRFQHHNFHGKAGLFNKYTAALEENEEQIAESVASLLKAFYP